MTSGCTRSWTRRSACTWRNRVRFDVGRGIDGGVPAEVLLGFLLDCVAGGC